MSGGRVEFGLGTGWFDAEHTAYGLTLPPLKERFDLYAEQLEIITGLWKTPVGEKYSFSGKNYTLVDSPALPKPAQSPAPPVIIGGGGQEADARSWRPASPTSSTCRSSREAVAAQFARVDAAAEAIGRDPRRSCGRSR